VGQGANEQRLGHSRNAFDEGVVVGEDANEASVDDIGLADDHLADFGARGGEDLLETISGHVRWARISQNCW
jgi:hypothetical protein